MARKKFSDKVKPFMLSQKNYNKVFCIGDNKTGTTTVYNILRYYGFNFPSQWEQEVRLTKQVLRANYKPMVEFCSGFDAFQDKPFSKEFVYIAADILFPDSKFILTERDPEDWFDSLYSFHKKIWGIESNLEDLSPGFIKRNMNHTYQGYFYEGVERGLTRFPPLSDKADIRWDLLYNKEYYIEQYMYRNEAIKRYFLEQPEKLLTIDITKEKTTKKIADFLKIPESFVFSVPHSNKT